MTNKIATQIQYAPVSVGSLIQAIEVGKSVYFQVKFIYILSEAKEILKIK